MTPALESEDYEQTRQALVKDQHIIDMANELMEFGHHPIEELVHQESETPRHEFMMTALREYHSRAGDNSIETHIGGPAEAVIRLMKERQQA
jgi:hypothetical protein